MKKIKVAQIGIGHNHGADKMKAFRDLPDFFDVVGVCEKDPRWYHERHKLEAYQGLPFLEEDELLATPGLEAVAIETDGPALLETAQKCADSGLHLHMDKPGGEDLQGFRKLCDTCLAKNLTLQLAYVYRNNPALKLCYDLVNQGVLGEIFEIHAVMSRDDSTNENYRRWMSQFKGGAMYIFGGYLIDIIIKLLGAPDKVTPFLRQTRDDGFFDNNLAVLEYPHATATVRVSLIEIDGFLQRRVVVCGTRGSFELCPIEHKDYSLPMKARLSLKEACCGYEAGTRMIDCGVLGKRYDSQLMEFARIVRGEIENPYGAEYEYTLHKALLEASNVVQ